MTDHLPSDAAMVVRPRLNALLDTMSERSLILVHAPPGHGKSVAVRHWIDHSRPRGRGWIDMARLTGGTKEFLELLAVSISGQGAVDMGPEQLVDLVAAAKSPLVTVLDRLDASPSVVQKLVDDMVQHLPGNWTVVATARGPSRLRVARLQSWLALGEVTIDDLRFRDDEAVVLMRQRFGHEVHEDVVHEVNHRLGGWAAGLALAGLAASAAPGPDHTLARFGASDPLIKEYLDGEFLPQIDPDMWHLVVETSFLSELNTSLCDAVTGRSDGQDQLTALAAWPGVTTRHQGGLRVVRLEPLVREWAEGHLRALPQERLTLLHDRAARWHAMNGHLASAVTFADMGGSPGLTADLLAQHGHELVLEGRGEVVLEAVSGLPPRMVDETPELAAIALGAAMASGRWGQVAAWSECIVAAAAGQPEPRRLALVRAATMGRVLHTLQCGQVNAASAEAARLPELAARPATSVMHIGWDGQQATQLTGLASLLAGTLPDPVGNGGDEGDDLGVPSVHSGLLALGAWLRGDAPSARIHALRALAAPGEHEVSVDRALACLALAWTGTLADVETARELRAAADPRGRWWLTALIDDLVEIEFARRSNHWRVVDSRVARARARVAAQPDPGAVDRLLLDPRLDQLTPREVDEPSPLTPREHEVLGLLENAMTRRELADELVVSIDTIKTHLRSIYSKLGASSRAEAIDSARRLGVLTGSGTTSSDPSRG